MSDGKLGVISSGTILNVGDVVRMGSVDKELNLFCAFPFADFIVVDVILPADGSCTSYNLIRPYMHLHVLGLCKAPLFGFEQLKCVTHHSMMDNFRQVLSDRDQPMNCKM